MVVWALFLQQVKCLNTVADVKDNDRLLTKQKLEYGHRLTIILLDRDGFLDVCYFTVKSDLKVLLIFKRG